jgi:predicted aspartyl protease
MQRLLLVALSALLFPAAATSASQDPEVTGITEDPTGQVVLLGERDTRMTVPVAVGGAGPYPFVVDTGAERTVISRELAGRLKLAPGPMVTVTTMTGSAPADTVVIPSLSITSMGEFGRIEAPAYAGRHLGAPGLLGIDTLAGHIVTIDFENHTMNVVPSTKRMMRLNTAPDEVVVRAKSIYGQLILTEAFFAGTRVRVLLDTGSTASVGNGAFMKRMGRSKATMVPITLTSVTGATTIAQAALVPRLKLGGMTFEHLPIAFSDVAPFKRLGLDKRPAIILGMDAMRAFRRVKIDFANQEVRFLMPREELLANK